MSIRLDGLSLDSLTADPTSPANGDIWHRSDLGQIRARVGGVTQTLYPASGVVRIDTHVFKFIGKPQVRTNVDGAWIMSRAGTIKRITLWRRTAGSSGTTQIDVNINGVTVFTTQGNRPAVTSGGGADAIDAKTNMDVTSFAQNDRIQMDIDGVEGGNPLDITVTIEVEYT